MLKTLKHQIRGFIFGIAVTVIVIGACHLQIDFRVNPAALEMSQNEKIAQQLETVMPKKVPHG